MISEWVVHRLHEQWARRCWARGRRHRSQFRGFSPSNYRRWHKGQFRNKDGASGHHISGKKWKSKGQEVHFLINSVNYNISWVLPGTSSHLLHLDYQTPIHCYRSQIAHLVLTKIFISWKLRHKKERPTIWGVFSWEKYPQYLTDFCEKKRTTHHVIVIMVTEKAEHREATVHNRCFASIAQAMSFTWPWRLLGRRQVMR